ncbi:MAG: Maf family protein [Gammaproteobacteria bacterium]
MPPLILASGSRYRRELLVRLGFAFEVLVPDVDERVAPGEEVSAATLRLARLKAAMIAARRPDALVLAGDQLASVVGQPVGKPRDEAEARRQLQAMSGRTVTYSTAIALVVPGAAEPTTHLDTSHVTLRVFGADEIARYVERERPFDCAGALKLEGLGSALCERIETSDPTALIGLPLIATASLLREVGYPVP